MGFTVMPNHVELVCDEKIEGLICELFVGLAKHNKVNLK
jgi:hypothetical protein